MNREKIIKKVIAKLQHKQGFKFLDWVSDKFGIKVPSKSEAQQILKDVKTEDIEKAYKVIPQLKTNDKVSFNMSSIKRHILILAALAVLAGGTLPANAAEASKMCDKDCQTKTVDIFKNFEVKEALPSKIFQQLKTPKDLNDVIVFALNAIRPMLKENNQKEPSPSKVKLFDKNNKELKNLADFQKALQIPNQEIQLMGS